MFQNLKKICVISAVFFPLLAFALNQEDDQPIQIVADSSLFNYKAGTTLYEGNVAIQQGSTHLTADRLITKNNNKHKIEEAIAYGLIKPADYSAIPKSGGTLFHATANIIKFYPTKFTIVLEGNVTVLQGESSFHGQLIIYNTKNQTVSAPASKGGRATFVIDPKKLRA